jgi:hypothetical protein
MIVIIASVRVDGNTVGDLGGFVAECDLYGLDDTTSLFDYPRWMPLTRHDGEVPALGTLADVKAWLASCEGLPAEHALSDELFELVVDFPATRAEPIQCGEHIPELVDGRYRTPSNLHVVVNPECLRHEPWNTPTTSEDTPDGKEEGDGR